LRSSISHLQDFAPYAAAVPRATNVANTTPLRPRRRKRGISKLKMSLLKLPTDLFLEVATRLGRSHPVADMSLPL